MINPFYYEHGESDFNRARDRDIRLPEPPREIPAKPARDAHAAHAASFTGQGGRNLWGCLNRMSYFWLRNGDSFWAYPTNIGWNRIRGFRHDGRSWRRFSMSPRQIDFHICL